MARLKGWKGSGKSVTLKSATVTYVSRGALVASSWPKKRGRPKSPITLEQNEWFRQANLLAKYADGQAQWMAIELSKDSPWYPRDILISAMAGRLFETLNLDGVEFRSVAIRDDVSSDIDFLAGKIQGTIMVRGPDLWQALVPGTAADVLTSTGPGSLPAWAPGASASALFVAAKVPRTDFGTDAGACKGIPIRPQVEFGIHALGTRMNATAGHVYRGYVIEFDSLFVATAITAETNDVTAPSTSILNIHQELIAPATLIPSKDYCLCWSRRDGADGFVLPIANGDRTLPMFGMPMRHFSPLNGIAPRMNMNAAQPQIGITFSTSTINGYYLTAQISL